MYFVVLVVLLAGVARAAQKPNFLIVLADDAGIGNFHKFFPCNSSAGNYLQTPSIDEFASESLLFDRARVTPVCAPTRSNLLTGQHSGHTTIRGNDGAYTPLKSTDVTFAKVLKQAGYWTGLVGKWGLGDQGTSGSPVNQSFDDFFGYFSQVACHNWYPNILGDGAFNNYSISPNDNACAVFSEDLFVNKTIDLLEERSKSSNPWAMFVSWVTPHAGSCDHPGNGIPSGPYAVPNIEPVYRNESWDQTYKDYASALTRQDRDFGKILSALSALSLEDDTIVMLIATDNGPEEEVDDFFNSASLYRGYKRSLWEGGVRAPVFVRWPGVTPKNARAHDEIVIYDVLPTLADLAGISPSSLPSNIDGISFAPALRGSTLPKREFMYWEFCQRQNRFSYGNGWGQSVVYQQEMKEIRLNKNYTDPSQPESQITRLLYNLTADPSEEHDLSNLPQFQSLLSTIEAIMDDEHVEDMYWPSGENCCDHKYSPGLCVPTEDVDMDLKD